ncbi:hypothetical protein GOV05_00160 [Candidatus Woesearchaeota archaeon]|nr:hypothetical protein [Candidatus Woesearchaeota archaeon]
MIEVVGFERGVEKVVDTVLSSGETPSLVSIHGFPNNGKTQLRSTARNKLFDKGVMGWVGMCGDSLDSLTRYDEEPSFYLIEDLYYTSMVQRYTTKHFGRLPELSIFITKKFDMVTVSPLIKELILAEVYGLIIENPSAVVKNPHW